MRTRIKLSWVLRNVPALILVLISTFALVGVLGWLSCRLSNLVIERWATNSNRGSPLTPAEPEFGPSGRCPFRAAEGFMSFKAEHHYGCCPVLAGRAWEEIPCDYYPRWMICSQPGNCEVYFCSPPSLTPPGKELDFGW